jgi:hypothetical protein
MKMDATKLIEFFGHSSIYEPLDDFLIENKIKKRPKSYETQSILLGHLDLRFEDTITIDEDFLIKPRSSGTYIFVEVVFHDAFPDQLPFGLKFNINESEFCKVLGQKLVAIDPEVERRNLSSLRFFYNNLFIVVEMNKDKTAATWIKFSLPDRYDYKHYNLK